MNSPRGIYCLVLPGILAFFFLAGCQQQKTEPSEQLKQISDKYYEIWNNGNVAELDEIIDPNFIYHKNNLPEIKGLDGIKKEITDLRTMYPDLKLASEEVIYSGNKIATRWHLTGTNTGPGVIPPTGKSIDIWGNAIVHTDNGKLKEAWSSYDSQAVMEQLGFKLIPPTAETK
jgi:predicted ester cyclase